ncbi:MAG: NAD(P)-binding domain-containing protein [Phycisphaerales bacterium]|jgi:thioredoxin reductase (NADPH)|nr:NAD(P)-binding domain-containing protein [Phycisphaerales bacterium]
MERTKVLIIGAGPIGLEVGFFLREVGIEAINVDAGGIGHTISRLFPPATRFFSSPERLAIAGMDCPVPTQEKITGEEYLAYLRSVVVTRSLAVRTFHRMTNATAVDGGFEVTLIEPSRLEHRLQADTIVIACGGTHRPRQLGIPGEDLGHVSSELGDPHRFFQRRVLIVGGRNSAVESSLRCWRAHAEVALSHRGEGISERVKYWLRPEVISLIEEGRIAAWMPSRPVAIEPGRVVLEWIGSGERFNVEADDVLLQIGYEQDDTLFRIFGVQCEGEQHAPFFNPETMETNVPGVFVAGTAVAGTQQRFKAYIETSHGHGPRIAAALTGAAPPKVDEVRVLPEG